MRRYPLHYYSDPAVMVPWCLRVGLDPDRVPVQGFSIQHDGGQHVAVFEYVETDDPFESAPRSERRMDVDVLPFPCALHPDVPAVGGIDGLAAP